jgi:hypothetical protein
MDDNWEEPTNLLHRHFGLVIVMCLAVGLALLAGLE